MIDHQIKGKLLHFHPNICSMPGMKYSWNGMCILLYTCLVSPLYDPECKYIYIYIGLIISQIGFLRSQMPNFGTPRFFLYTSIQTLDILVVIVPQLVSGLKSSISEHTQMAPKVIILSFSTGRTPQL